MFTYLQPIAVIIYSILLLGEKITLPFLIGGTLAVVGAGMTSVNAKIQPLPVH